MKFTVAKSQPGTYNVAINNIPVGNFAVVESVVTDTVGTPLIIEIALIFFALVVGILGYILRTGRIG